jgi:hypothetical protein
MPLIGTREHAAEILDGYNRDRGRPPKGWEKIGNGGYRYAYLHKDTQVVYKCERRCDCGAPECDRYSNSQEVTVAQALLQRAFEHVRIPLTSGFRIADNIVVAMEFIKGSRPALIPDEAYIELYKLRFADMHMFNYLFDEAGKIVPIDMASPRNTGADTRVLQPMRDRRFREREERKRGW